MNKGSLLANVLVYDVSKIALVGTFLYFVWTTQPYLAGVMGALFIINRIAGYLAERQLFEAKMEELNDLLEQVERTGTDN